jgi:hypothetical protein
MFDDENPENRTGIYLQRFQGVAMWDMQEKTVGQRRGN